MLKKLALSFALVFAAVSTLQAKPLNLNQVLEATCRVRAGSGFGSGTCIDKENNKYYILTNAHVVGGRQIGSKVTVEFFRGGDKTVPIPATIVWKEHNNRTTLDFAILSVEARYFGKYPPRVIPLVPLKYKLAKQQYISSAGSPGGEWAKAWEGKLLNAHNPRVYFTPPPRGGQSGSGLFVLVNIGGKLYTRLGAVITWRVGPNGHDANGYDLARGGAIPVSNLYAALGYTQETLVVETVPDDHEEIADERFVSRERNSDALRVLPPIPRRYSTEDRQQENINRLPNLLPPDVDETDPRPPVLDPECNEKLDAHRAQLEALELELRQYKTDNTDDSNKNIIYTILASTGVLMVLGWLWKKIRPGITKSMDAVEDKLQDRIDDYIGEDLAQKIRSGLDAIEKRIGDRISDIFEAENEKGTEMKANVHSISAHDVEPMLQRAEERIIKLVDEKISQSREGRRRNHTDRNRKRRNKRRRNTTEHINTQDIMARVEDRIVEEILSKLNKDEEE